jgi:hypothetical protein
MDMSTKSLALCPTFRYRYSDKYMPIAVIQPYAHFAKRMCLVQTLMVKVIQTWVCICRCAASFGRGEVGQYRPSPNWKVLVTHSDLDEGLGIRMMLEKGSGRTVLLRSSVALDTYLPDQYNTSSCPSLICNSLPTNIVTHSSQQD